MFVDTVISVIDQLLGKLLSSTRLLLRRQRGLVIGRRLSATGTSTIINIIERKTIFVVILAYTGCDNIFLCQHFQSRIDLAQTHVVQS